MTKSNKNFIGGKKTEIKKLERRKNEIRQN